MSRRVEVSPAALGSIGLHGALAIALMISWGSRDLKVGGVVPVTIVSRAPDADTRPAEQAPQTQSAQTEAPVAEAPPEPAPPPPRPAPPVPTPTPKAAKPAEKAPAPLPAKPATKPVEKSLDFDSLYDSLAKPARNAPQRPSAAAKGPTRAETAPVARQTLGTGLAAGADAKGLADDLRRHWHLNCNVEGGRDVLVRVVFRIGVGGQVEGEVASELKSPGTAVGKVGAEAAARAVYATAPFRGLPREFYGQQFAVNFDAREACANQ
ncbi:energy transducer TonB [Phenylobacterium sp.]|uniref:energy transducer TonB n=1 Tax=Phenylobacterium sp. TaxID=1871053 RepID=UPI0025CFE44C|nr:energy transducer TonB [Phenylobacterium sp.]